LPATHPDPETPQELLKVLLIFGSEVGCGVEIRTKALEVRVAGSGLS
jgi:hypothetical protein